MQLEMVVRKIEKLESFKLEKSLKQELGNFCYLKLFQFFDLSNCPFQLHVSRKNSDFIDISVHRTMSKSGLGLGVSDISISFIDRKLSKIYKIKFT